MKINIFENKKFEINLPTFIDSRALICANSGGGKSYAVRKILEESNNKVMSIILDIEGEFRTLREQYDFLLIGNEGDVELNMKSAKLLPKKIMEMEVSTIIDISDLKRNERVKYVKDFLEALMELNRKYWKPCLIVLDEVHQLAGQQEKQDSTSSVIDLATRGRKRGYCLIGCTQRISKLHKDVVAELNNYMVGRTGLDIDQKRAGEILGFTNKKDVLSLRDLEAGEFYVFGTAISKYVTKAKVKEVKTTHPKVGMDLTKEIIKPTNKIINILSQVKDLPREAEEKLKDLNDYKKRVMELNRELRISKSNKPKPQNDERQLERARQLGFREAEIKHNNQTNNLKNSYNQLERRIRDIGRIIGKEIPKVNQIKSDNISKLPISTKLVPKKELPKHTEVIDGEYNLSLCERKLYSLLYQYSERTFTKAQVGVFTGYSHKSGGFNNSISRLKQLNLIEGSGNSLKAKELVQDLAKDYDFSKEEIISKLSKCEKEIYNVLLENPNDEFSKEELANNTQTQYSFNSGGFNNSISRLNTLGLIERNNGNIKLNQELLELE